MTFFLIALFAVTIIVLSIILAFIDAEKHPGLRLAIALADAVVGILTLVLSLMTISVPEPVVFPLNGMLTEEHPAVTIVNDEIWMLGANYYGEDSNSFPADSGNRYIAPFIPDHSGTYYAQSKFLWKRSKGCLHNNLDKLGFANS